MNYTLSKEAVSRPPPERSTTPSRPIPSSSSSSSRASPYRSSYTSSRYVYSPVTYQPLIMNTIFLLWIEHQTYISMTYVSTQQYCPLQSCPPINETYVRTPLAGNTSTALIANSTYGLQNATQVNMRIKSKYGCSIDFGNCMESVASERSHLDPNMVLLMMVMTLFFLKY
jgi:hypothetical protein